MARTDGHNHRPVAGDSGFVEAVKVLARAHLSLIWSRQRHTNQLRSTLREFYPAALEAFEDLSSSETLAMLGIAPTPAEGRRLSKPRVAAALRRGGRQRRIDERAAHICAGLRTPHLEASAVVAEATRATVTALVSVTAKLVTQIGRPETELANRSASVWRATSPRQKAFHRLTTRSPRRHRFRPLRTPITRTHWAPATGLQRPKPGKDSPLLAIKTARCTRG